MNPGDSAEQHVPIPPGDAGDLLQDAVETLAAFRSDAVDGYVVTTPAGDRVVLADRGVERPYQLMVDGMSEGAATVALDGTILYVNRRLGAMLGRSPESLLGSSFFDLVQAQHGSVLRAVIDDGVDTAWRGDVMMRGADAADLPVHLSLNSLTLEHTVVRSILLTDLRDQQRTDAIVAEGRLAQCILEQAAEAIVVCDEDGLVQQVNREALRLCEGRDPRGRPFTEAFELEYVPGTPQAVDLLQGQAHPIRAQTRGERGTRQLMVGAARLFGAEGRAIGAVVTLTDVTDLHRATEQLERRARHQLCTAELSRSALAGAPLSDLVEASRAVLGSMLPDAAVRITGRFESADPTGPKAPVHAGVLRREIKADETVLGYVEVDPGVDRTLAVDDLGLVDAITSLLCLAAERQGLHDKLHHQAHHDALTGLPNRVLLDDRLQQALARAQRDGTLVAVLFIDLDRFKHVNDTLGHEAGDEVLIEIAARLRQHVRSSDTVARVGGDEFVMIHSDLKDAADARAIAATVAETLAHPHRVGGRSVRMRATVGISIFPDDGHDTTTLLMKSDSAMYHGKRGGRNTIRHFTQEMHEITAAQLELEHEFQAALSSGALVLHFQPQVCARTGELRGMEALARWRHPQRGWIGPSEFVPVAEELGLVTELGTWALTEACRQAGPWMQGVPGPRSISVNVSPTQLVQPDFIDVVDVALHGAGLEPRHLELEVTEGITMHDIDTVRRRLFELRDLGVRIALDDFGLGYSSIGTLRSLPLDRLKVDKSLVGPGDGDPITPEEQRAVLAAITTMAQTFGLQVTVEGIETDTQLEMAIDVGCDDVQGYLFGPPLPAERVVGFLADWRPHLPSVAATPRAGSSGVERPRPRRRAQGGP